VCWLLTTQVLSHLGKDSSFFLATVFTNPFIEHRVCRDFANISSWHYGYLLLKISIYSVTGHGPVAAIYCIANAMRDAMRDSCSGPKSRAGVAEADVTEATEYWLRKAWVIAEYYCYHSFTSNSWGMNRVMTMRQTNCVSRPRGTHWYIQNRGRAFGYGIILFLSSFPTTNLVIKISYRPWHTSAWVFLQSWRYIRAFCPTTMTSKLERDRKFP